MTSHKGHGYAGLRILSGERALSIVIGLAVLACPCTAIEFAGGTGEPNDPYLIARTEQLLQAPFGGIGLHWRLCCDIDLAGIRTRSDRLPFPLERLEGHFDGAGHRILHARIVGPGIIGHTGFFSEIGSEGTVVNLTLRDIDIGALDWSDCVGALTGKNCGTVANCGAEAWIVGNDAGVVGGLVGVNEGSITNCWFDGWVSSDCEHSLFAITYLSVGGLVGLNEGTISGCYATGIVAGATGVGGLVGRNWADEGRFGSIRDCYATAWVRAEVGGGGLVGDNRSSLAYCYAAGTTEGSMRGGLVGTARWWDTGTSVGCLWEGVENPQGSGAGIGLDSLAMKRA
jgi:hypothetical protein